MAETETPTNESPLSAELHGIIIGCCLPALRPLYLVVFKRPGREIYTSKNKKAAYVFKDFLPLSHNSNARRAPIEDYNHSNEDFLMPGIAHTNDMEVSYEAQGQVHEPGHVHEAGWVAKPENTYQLI